MIAQISSATSQPQVQTSGSQAPVVDIKAQKTAAPVELPQQAVKPIEKAEKVELESVKKAADQINNLIQQFNRDLNFSVDDDTGLRVVKLIDTKTEEVIRQFPSEELLAIAKALDKLQGLLVRDKV